MGRRVVGKRQASPEVHWDSAESTSRKGTVGSCRNCERPASQAQREKPPTDARDDRQNHQATRIQGRTATRSCSHAPPHLCDAFARKWCRSYCYPEAAWTRMYPDDSEV